MKRSQNSRVLELLADGQPHHHHELYELMVVAHSRVADLRRFGYAIRTWQAPDQRTGERLHWYELQRVPVEAPAIERTLGEPARAQLEEIRRTRGSGSASGPSGGSAGPSAAACHASAPIDHDEERAAVAQSVERDVANVEVAGSRPASRFPTDSEPAPEQGALFDAPAAVPDREYEAPRGSFVCAADLEAELELQAIEQELQLAAEFGVEDLDRHERLLARRDLLNGRILGRAA